jgi:multiple sugar transport system substrate-binding protein
MGYEGEVVAKMLPEFERQHPDIHVDLQIVPWLSRTKSC